MCFVVSASYPRGSKAKGTELSDAAMRTLGYATHVFTFCRLLSQRLDSGITVTSLGAEECRHVLHHTHTHSLHPILHAN